MSKERRQKSPEARDIDAIFEHGVAHIAGPGLEQTSRVRRAFDVAWETVYTTVFSQFTSSDPREQFIEVFDKLLQMDDDQNSQRILQFTCMGYWMKTEQGVAHDLYYGDDAKYMFEDKFTEDLTAICTRGDITCGGRYTNPEQAAQYVMTFMTITILTWLMGGEKSSPNFSVNSMRKSICDLAYDGNDLID